MWHGWVPGVWSPGCFSQSTITQNKLTRDEFSKHFLSGCTGLLNNTAVGGEGNEGNLCPLQQETYMKEFIHSAQGINSYYTMWMMDAVIENPKQWYLNLWLGRRNAEACSNYFLSWSPTIIKYHQFMGLNALSWGINCQKSITYDIQLMELHLILHGSLNQDGH